MHTPEEIRDVIAHRLLDAKASFDIYHAIEYESDFRAQNLKVLNHHKAFFRPIADACLKQFVINLAYAHDKTPKTLSLYSLVKMLSEKKRQPHDGTLDLTSISKKLTSSWKRADIFRRIRGRTAHIPESIVMPEDDKTSKFTYNSASELLEETFSIMNEVSYFIDGKVYAFCNTPDPGKATKRVIKSLSID